MDAAEQSPKSKSKRRTVRDGRTEGGREAVGTGIQTNLRTNLGLGWVRLGAMPDRAEPREDETARGVILTLSVFVGSFVCLNQFIYYNNSVFLFLLLQLII